MTSNDQGVALEVKTLIQQAIRLLKLELELAKNELSGKAGSLGKAAGLLIGAILFGLLSLCVITTAAVLGLATLLAGWLSALIVFGTYLLLAGLMAVIGLRGLKKAAPLVPERSIQSLKGDLEWVEAKLKSAGT